VKKTLNPEIKQQANLPEKIKVKVKKTIIPMKLKINQ